MKTIAAVLVLSLFAVVSGCPANEQMTLYDYHRQFGIKEASRIKEFEENLSLERRTRIVGGTFVDISNFPYQAGLIIDVGIGESICGGSIISTSRILTAAHCQYDGVSSARSFTVVLGSNLLFNGGIRIRANNAAVMHPYWHIRTKANDIAVFRTPSFSFNSQIQPIALPSGNEINNDFVGSVAVASGYGCTSDYVSIGPNQRISAVNLPIITNAECSLTYGSSIQNSIICTSGRGRKGTCRGDSGGPLAVTIGSKRVLIGVTSFGSILGCQANLPGAFTRVSYFLDFIMSNM